MRRSHEGLSWGWNSFAEYLDACDTAQRHGHRHAGPPRRAASPRDGRARRRLVRMPRPTTSRRWDRSPPRRSRRVRSGSRTSRTSNHARRRPATSRPTLTAAAGRARRHRRGRRRRPAPACSSSCRTSSTSTPSSQIVPRSMAERSRVDRCRSRSSRAQERTEFSTSDLLELIDRGERRRRARSPASARSRPIGILLGFECTLNPFMRNPVGVEVADPAAGRTGRRAERPRPSRAGVSTAGRRVPTRPSSAGAHREVRDACSRWVESPYYEPAADQTVVDARAAAAGVSPAEFALDLLLTDGGTNMLWLPFTQLRQGQSRRHPRAADPRLHGARR